MPVTITPASLTMTPIQLFHAARRQMRRVQDAAESSCFGWTRDLSPADQAALDALHAAAEAAWARGDADADAPSA